MKIINGTSPKICILSYVTHGKDSLRPLGCHNPNYDYFCLTDDPGFQHDIYKPLLVEPISDFEQNYRRTIKFKYLSHRHPALKDYNYHIVHDGNVQIISDLTPLAERCAFTIGTFKHYEWDCVYKSFEMKRQLIRKGLTCLDTIDNLNKHEKLFRVRDFPEHAGYWSPGAMLKDYRNPSVKECMDELEREYDRGCYRDQISLAWAIVQTGCEVTTLEEVFRSNEWHRYFIRHAHNHGGH